MFGTVAYLVQQRMHEFGIRLALGATPAHFLRSATEQVFVVGVAGLLVGVVAALALGRVVGSSLYLEPGKHGGMLYGVKIYDPLSMSLACVLLLFILFLASFIPARRAMRADPMVTLRHE